MSIIILAGSDGPEERNKKAACHAHAEANEHNDDGHQASLLRRAMARTDSVVKATTEMELSGIRIAAMSGESCPEKAKYSPTTLYAMERQKLAITTRTAKPAKLSVCGEPDRGVPLHPRRTG